MKVEIIPPGQTGMTTKLSESERKRLCIDYNPEKYGQDIERIQTISVCNCQGGTHNTLEKDGVCQLCGHFTYEYNLDEKMKTVKYISEGELWKIMNG